MSVKSKTGSDSLAPTLTGLNAKQKASKRAMKTFNYANSVLANTPAIVLEPLNDTFSAKTLDLFEPIKIGRKVNPKMTPEPDNGIFDSKVLSRNHAEIWFADNKVWIKDVKSSNGTFVDGKRLSDENVESDPYELRSGARLEFGIDINNEDGTVMYNKVSCKVAIIEPSPIGAPSAPTTDTEPGRISVGRSAKGQSSKRGTLHALMDQELQQAEETNSQLKHLKENLGRVEIPKAEAVQQQPLPQDTEAISAAVTVATASIQTQLDNARAEAKTWSAEVNRLRTELQNIEAIKKEIEEWKSKAEKADEELESLKEASSKASTKEAKITEKAQNNDKKLEALRSDMQKLQQEKEILQKEKQGIIEEMNTLRKQLQDAQEDAKIQQAAYEKLKKDMAEVEKMNQALKATAMDELRKANEALQTASSPPLAAREKVERDSPNKKDTGPRRRKARKSGLVADAEEESGTGSVEASSKDRQKNRSPYQMLAIVAFGILSVGGIAYIGLGHGVFNPDSSLVSAIAGAF